MDQPVVKPLHNIAAYIFLIGYLVIPMYPLIRDYLEGFYAMNRMQTDLVAVLHSVFLALCAWYALRPYDLMKGGWRG